MDCEHDWQPTATPMVAAYKCTKCQVLGYDKYRPNNALFKAPLTKKNPQVVPYVCHKCQAPAIERKYQKSHCVNHPSQPERAAKGR